MNKKKFYFEGEETNYSVSSDGRVFNDKTGKELKGTIKRNEYRSVQFTINGKPKSFMVHRLVAELFCENSNNYTIVDHIDRDKMNNCADNLRWVDNQTNILNAERKQKAKEKKYEGKFDDFNYIKEISFAPIYYITIDGKVINSSTKKYLLGSERNGYRRVELNGKKYSIHRLVWETFKGKINESYVIDHIDGNRSNNNLNNLRLVTQKENMDNAMRNNHNCQRSVSQYDLEGNFIKNFPSITAAAREINGNGEAIGQAIKRKGTSRGYYWTYKDEILDTQNLISNKKKVNSLGVTKYSLQGEKMEHYVSLKEAARQNNCSDSTIQRAAKNLRQGIGFYWIMDNQDITIEQLINN